MLSRFECFFIEYILCSNRSQRLCSKHYLLLCGNQRSAFLISVEKFCCDEISCEPIIAIFTTGKRKMLNNLSDFPTFVPITEYSACYLQVTKCVMKNSLECEINVHRGLVWSWNQRPRTRSLLFKVLVFTSRVMSSSQKFIYCNVAYSYEIRTEMSVFNKIKGPAFIKMENHVRCATLSQRGGNLLFCCCVSTIETRWIEKDSPSAVKRTAIKWDTNSIAPYPHMFHDWIRGKGGIIKW